MTTRLFGIRHHGAGSARHLIAALREYQPDCILLEGPPEADALLPLAAEADMQPPVALLAYRPDAPQQAVYYPFAAFSPEWQAMRYAAQAGIPLQFCDLPLAHSLYKEETPDDSDENAAEDAAPEDDEIDSEDGGEAEDEDTAEEPRHSDPFDELAAIAFRHAHPEWVAKSFEQALGGRDELDAALAADSERPIVHLVARPGEITAEELALMTGGDEGTYSPYAVYLPGGDPGRIDAVRDGLAAVQDEGSQLIARALTEAPLDGPDGGHWLDLCAGPGGKAALLGAIARIESATVDAVEVQPHRAKLVQQTVRDLPVTVHTMDGRNPSFEYQFDRVLVDAPCSGLGALRRRPEARWRKQESDIAQLAQLQYELLASAINLTRPGGVIVYSTCSPDLRETRGVVNKALENHPVVELDAHPLVPNMENTGEEKSVQMWPHRHHTDAMFFAVLKKTPEKLG